VQIRRPHPVGVTSTLELGAAIKSRMVKKLRLLKGGSVPTFVGLGPVLHNKLAVDA
jgi:hypothetical protein